MKKLALLFVFAQSLIYAQGEQRYADGTATDQDGNTFEWINYGTQDWAIENAEVVTYRDGTPIPQVTDQAEWANLTTGAWCYYNNDPSKGKLYNWYAAAGIHDNDPNTPNKEFAPVGWHVPTDADWITLENYLITNGYNYDGTITENKIAKSMASTSGWNSSTISGAVGNDQNLNNTSGFNPSTTGNRLGSGFWNEGHNLIFWSADDSSEGNSCELAWYRSLYAAYNYLDKNRTCKRDGGYVRLIKDSQFVTNAQILLNGTVSAENNQIKNVADPTDNLDAVNKRYVDQRTLEQTIPGQNIGDLLYWNGQSWQKLSAPQEQSTLRFCEGQLTWGTCKPFVKIEEINFCFSGEYPSSNIVKYSISNNGSTPTNDNYYSGEIVYVSKTNQNPDENDYDLMLKPYPNSDWSNYEETESIEGGGIYYFNDGETYYFRVRIISNNGVSYSETVSKTYIADSNTNDCDGDGFTVGQGDCNDDNGRIYPGADEIPDGADNNCDNVIDNYPGGGIVLDNEGNKYPYVTIGDKKWTIISADVVTYRDGTPIPQVTDATEWSNLTTGAWCYAYNENSWVRLYNWYAVAGIHDNDDGTPNKEFAPDGWRVPTFNDWSELETFLISNGYNWDHTTTDNKISSSLTYYEYFSVEGNRNIYSPGWEKSEISGSPGRRFVNINTNFQANPWGYRSSWTGEFEGVENLALFWSSTSSNSVLGTYMIIYHDRVYTELTNNDSIWKSGGMQVRFVKD